jgi:O-antigen ligase
VEIIFIVAVIAYFIFTLWRLEWAVTAFPLLLPFYLFKVNFFVVPCTLVEAIIYAMFAAFILRWIYENLSPHSWVTAMFTSVKAGVVRRVPFTRRYKSLLVPLVVFVFAAFLSLLFVQNITLFDGQVFDGMKTALGILKGWIIAPVLYLLLLMAVIKSNNRLLDVLNFYGLSAVILSIWALFQVTTDGYSTMDARASGPFESANYLSLYIVPALVYSMVRIKELIIPLSVEEKSPFWQRVFARKNVKEDHPEVSLFIIGFLLIFLALLATKAYAGMLSALIAGLFYFGLEYVEFRIRHTEAKNPWKFLIGFVVFVVVILGIIYVIDPGKWQSMFQFDERNSSSVRVEVYQVSGGLLAENWLTGIGMGHYEPLYKENAVEILGHEPYEWNMLHPHNLFIAMWLNLGLLGLIAFIWILVVTFKRSAYHFRKFASTEINSAAKLRVLGMALLVSILVYGLFDTQFFKNDLSVLFWIIIAVIFVADHEDIPEEK